MSAPSSPPPPPPPSSSSSPKKPQPIPWTQEETLQLILTYQDKWYSSKRRHLKAPHWEEVAAAVASRCGHDLASSSSPAAKSGTQCRHKMEKLRRRYRSELPRAAVSAWPFFSLMDSMERGPPTNPPLPIAARPLSLVPLQTRPGSDDYYGDDQDEDGEEEEEEEEEDYETHNSKSRSINHILRKPSVVNRFPGNDSGFLLPLGRGKRKRGVEEEEKEEGLGLVEEVKRLVEKMKGVERRKMEMVKETERWRMEMERKRMEMMLASQRKILDMIAASSSSSSAHT